MELLRSVGFSKLELANVGKGESLKGHVGADYTLAGFAVFTQVNYFGDEAKFTAIKTKDGVRLVSMSKGVANDVDTLVEAYEGDIAALEKDIKEGRIKFIVSEFNKELTLMYHD